jgi:tetratricopeptide (TPR) repeat protein
MNDFENALKTYKSLLKKDPDNYKAYNNIGNIYKKINPDSAARYYSLAITSQPQSAAASYNLGLVYLSKGESSLAERYFKMALENNPGDLKSAYYLGEIYYKEGDYLSAANSYIQAFHKSGPYVDDSPQYFEFNDVLLADANAYVDYVSTVLKLDLNEVQRYYDKAGAELQQGNYKEAAELYYIVASADPAFPQTYLNLGLALEKNGRYGKAIEAYNKAIELNQKNAKVYVNLGNCYYVTGDKEKAVEAYNNSLAFDSSNAEVYFNLALAAPSYNAEEYYAKALALDSNMFKAKINLTALYGNEGEYQKAVELMAKNSQNTDAFPELLYNMGLLYGRQGDYAKADETLKKFCDIAKNKIKKGDSI